MAMTKTLLHFSWSSNDDFKAVSNAHVCCVVVTTDICMLSALLTCFFVCVLVSRLPAQHPSGPDGKLSGVPENDAVPAERDRPRPTQTPAHVRESLQAGQEGKLLYRCRYSISIYARILTQNARC